MLKKYYKKINKQENHQDNDSDASSNVLGALSSLKREEPQYSTEALNMDEDNIPEEVFENIHTAIENITNLSEQANSQAHKDESSSPDYTNMTVNQLKSILTDLGLPTSGNKTKLIQRIQNQESKSLKI